MKKQNYFVIFLGVTLVFCSFFGLISEAPVSKNQLAAVVGGILMMIGQIYE